MGQSWILSFCHNGQFHRKSLLQNKFTVPRQNMSQGQKVWPAALWVRCIHIVRHGHIYWADFVQNDSFMSFVWLLNYDSPLNHKRFNTVSIRAAEKLILCRCKEPHSAFSVDHLSAFLFSVFEISGCEKTSSSFHFVLKL